MSIALPPPPYHAFARLFDDALSLAVTEPHIEVTITRSKAPRVTAARTSEPGGVSISKRAIRLVFSTSDDFRIGLLLEALVSDLHWLARPSSNLHAHELATRAEFQVLSRLNAFNQKVGVDAR